MSIHLHNTLSRRKEAFAPIDPANVRLYVCGPTVYDLAHIGNARPVVVFDTLYRLLRHVYGDRHVTYVRNITDVEDKIIAAAAANGEPIDALTRRTAVAYHEDMAALNALPPTFEPRATEHIDGMVAMIATLIERGFAYAAEGHVLFNVPSMAEYGRLSGRSLDEMIAGARVEVAPYKKHPADFVLWKPARTGEPGWDSPWGRGRPGWHIECSAMSKALLGETFDIHGGGIDLIFPHHENEIAQSRCAHDGAPLARYWMHNGFVQVNGEKMSKSLGNFFTVRELLEQGHRGEAIRLALLSAHYRQPLDITRDGLGEAKAMLDRFYAALDKAGTGAATAAESAEPPFDLLAALEDDLNTPLALSHLHELLARLNKAGDAGARGVAAAALKRGGALLGLLQQDPAGWLRGTRTLSAGVDAVIVLSDGKIDQLIEARTVARKNRDFAEADRIRSELLQAGVILEDSAAGTTWRRA
ncbi:MAG: cysteine--tRNA ligase [Hyphomicrobium sp.]|uniref:cysteine--tRNA ligase n=1 Tax=Hyphomicrobium sp. TaxID=82 RepID=UPI003D0CEAB2